MDRELFVRAIPPETITTSHIDLERSSLPPLQFSRERVVEVVRELEPTARSTNDGRVDVSKPGLKLAIAMPGDEPLWMVMIRVFRGSDRQEVDHFVAQLLHRLDAKAFDTAAETLICTSPDRSDQ